MNSTKRCPRCGRTLDLSGFYSSPYNPSWHSSWCKECSSEYNNKVKHAERKNHKTHYRKWSQKDVDDLKQLYPDNFNNDLERIFGRDAKNIAGKARMLGIKKSREHIISYTIKNLKTYHESNT